MGALDLDLLPAVIDAVTGGGLVLHYQPEVDLADGSVVGMEALLRLRHPERGLLWPGEFLDLAESAGLLADIGAWVVGTCVAEAARWTSGCGRGARADWQLWMNVAAAQLADASFIGFLTDQLVDAGLPPGRIGVEVTEEALDQLGSTARDRLAELRAAGLALAVDDFGTWYSSLATIGDLPVDAIKLDRSFVRGVGSDLADDEIVASVIRLAHARDLYVVAEGVESWAEGARLTELGCDRAHGYLFAGPQRAERARWLLDRGFGWRGGPPSDGAIPLPREDVRPLAGQPPLAG